jgi:type I restriction enzyme S subunit
MLDKKKNKGIQQPYLGNSNVRWGEFDLSDLAQMKFEESEHERYGITHGDLIVCEGGEPGRCAIWKAELPDMKIQKALHRIRTKSSLNNRYLYYWFYHAGKHGLLEPYFTGTTIKHLTGRALNNLEIPLPPLSHQEFMAEVLGSLDDKIQLNHQTNQTLEQMAQAIFKSWFVDFEPVKAKIAALEAGGSEEDALLAAMQAISGKDETELTRLQAEQPEQYAELRATAELFPSAMQDSELGEIPEGWYVTQIGDEVTVVGGGTPSTKNPDFWENGEINWTSPKDLSNLADKVLVETERKVTEAGLAKISSGLLPVDTVLMSSRAPVGYLALAKIPVAVNQGYIAMKCEKALSPEFVIQWCAAHMDEIKSRASGTTFAEISKKNFKIIPVVMPTESLISIYSKQASSLYEAIENNVRESDTLAKLRDSLLPKLLSGELSVSDVESHIADEAEPANV